MGPINFAKSLLTNFWLRLVSHVVLNSVKKYYLVTLHSKNLTASMSGLKLRFHCVLGVSFILIRDDGEQNLAMSYPTEFKFPTRQPTRLSYHLIMTTKEHVFTKFGHTKNEPKSQVWSIQ